MVVGFIYDLYYSVIKKNYLKFLCWKSLLSIKNNFIKILVYFTRLQTLKNKQSSSCRLQTFSPPLLLHMFADMVRKLQMFCLSKNKQQPSEVSNANQQPKRILNVQYLIELKKNTMMCPSKILKECSFNKFPRHHLLL